MWRPMQMVEMRGSRMNEADRLCSQQVRPFVSRGKLVEAIDAIEKSWDLLMEQKMDKAFEADNC